MFTRIFALTVIGMFVITVAMVTGNVNNNNGHFNSDNNTKAALVMDATPVSIGADYVANDNNYNITVPPDIDTKVFEENDLIALMKKATHVINQIRVNFIYPVGTISGVLTLIILNRSGPRALHVTPFLFFISLMDTVYNSVLLIALWLPYVNSTVCAVAYHVIFGVSHVSDWAITAVATIRAIAVAIPHKVKSLMTRKKGRMILGVIVILENLVELTGSLSAYYPKPSKGNPFMGNCFNAPKTQFFPLLYGYYVIVSKIVMAVILTVCSGVIIYTLNNRQESTDSGEKGRQIVKMLVSVIILFLITQIPGSVFFAIAFEVDFFAMGPYYIVLFGLLMEVFSTLKAINHAANFFVYCLSAKMFRDEILTIFCRKTIEQNPPSHFSKTEQNAT